MGSLLTCVWIVKRRQAAKGQSTKPDIASNTVTTVDRSTVHTFSRSCFPSEWTFSKGTESPHRIMSTRSGSPTMRPGFSTAQSPWPSAHPLSHHLPRSGTAPCRKPMMQRWAYLGAIARIRSRGRRTRVGCADVAKRSLRRLANVVYKCYPACAVVPDARLATPDEDETVTRRCRDGLPTSDVCLSERSCKINFDSELFWTSRYGCQPVRTKMGPYPPYNETLGGYSSPVTGAPREPGQNFPQPPDTGALVKPEEYIILHPYVEPCCTL